MNKVTCRRANKLFQCMTWRNAFIFLRFAVCLLTYLMLVLDRISLLARIIRCIDLALFGSTLCALSMPVCLDFDYCWFLSRN